MNLDLSLPGRCLLSGMRHRDDQGNKEEGLTGHWRLESQLEFWISGHNSCLSKLKPFIIVVHKFINCWPDSKSCLLIVINSCLLRTFRHDRLNSKVVCSLNLSHLV